MATATVEKKKVVNPEKARSAVVRAILTTLNRKSWTSKEELVKVCSPHINKKAALKVYDFRIGHEDVKPMTKVAKGRACQVMLTCITLIQHSKIIQRGRGDTKEYKLA